MENNDHGERHDSSAVWDEQVEDNYNISFKEESPEEI